MTITGTGVHGATAVNFGTTAATNLNVVNDTTITVNSPAGTGTVDVTVITPGGTSSAARLPISSPTRRLRADSHGPEPDQRSGDRRHPGDDHGHRLYGGHRGQFRLDARNGPHRGQRHHDHGRQSGGHRRRDGERDGGHTSGYVAHFDSDSVHVCCHRANRCFPVAIRLSHATNVAGADLQHGACRGAGSKCRQLPDSDDGRNDHSGYAAHSTTRHP